MSSDPFRVITQAESWKQAVQTDVVERLEELLEMAKSGEITGIAYSSSCADGMTLTGYTKTENRLQIVGGLELVKYRMISDD